MSGPKTKARVTIPEFTFCGFTLESFQLDVDVELLEPVTGDVVLNGNPTIISDPSNDNKGIFWKTSAGAGIASIFTQASNHKLVLDSENISITPSRILQEGGKGEKAMVNIQVNNLGTNTGDTADSGLLYFTTARRLADGSESYLPIAFQGVQNGNLPEVHIIYPVDYATRTGPVVMRLGPPAIGLPWQVL